MHFCLSNHSQMRQGCSSSLQALYKNFYWKNIHIALIGYLERETFMNPLHTLFPFKGFQYTPASISLHRESDRNLSTTLIHEKIIQKNIFSFYSFSDPGSTYFLGLLCLSLKEVRGPDSMKCMYMISRDRDHSEGWGQLPFGTFPKIHLIW